MDQTMKHGKPKPSGVEASEFSRIVRWRFFAAGYGPGDLRKRHGTGAIGSAGADVGPFYLSGRIDNVGDRSSNRPGPMPFVRDTTGANQLGARVRH